MATSFDMRDPFSRHVSRVDTVATIAPPPPQWTELRDRFDGFTDFDSTPLRERLIEAVVNGGDDVPMLRALAYAEASGERVDVIVAVRGAVYPRLVQLYSEVALSNYAKVAKEFDATASEFTAAAGKCDPEADGDAIVGQPDPVRTGWLDTAKYADELNRLTPILQAAAELGGIATADDTALLPL